MYKTLNSLFFGIPKSGVRDIAGQIVRETHFDTYIIPCTGRFALADTFASAGLNPEQMLTGDISLFSSVIGYYLSGKNISDLGITIQGEKIKPDIEGIAETLYHLKLGSIKPSNYYLEEVLEDLRHGKVRHIEKLTTDLEALKERLTGIKYELKDMRIMLDEWKDKNVFIFINPPLFSNRDYVTMFNTDIIKWQEPNIAQFDPKIDFAPMMDDLRQTKATVVVYLREKNKDDDLVKGWYSFFANQDTKAEAEYLYSNKDLEVIQAKRVNVDNPQRAPYNILTDKDEITENSELSVVNINHEQAMYYRDLFVHRLGVSQAEISLLLLIDEKIFSVRGLMYYRGGGPDYTATEIFGLIAPNKRYRHLGRLAMRAITCTDFRDAITPKNEMFPKRFITSTTLSKYPEAREDKGILEIYDTELLKKTGLYRLRYKTGFKEKTFKDCLIEWLNEEKKYGEQKHKKKRIRPRQRDVS